MIRCLQRRLIIIVIDLVEFQESEVDRARGSRINPWRHILKTTSSFALTAFKFVPTDGVQTIGCPYLESLSWQKQLVNGFAKLNVVWRRFGCRVADRMRDVSWSSEDSWFVLLVIIIQHEHMNLELRELYPPTKRVQVLNWRNMICALPVCKEISQKWSWVGVGSLVIHIWTLYSAH